MNPNDEIRQVMLKYFYDRHVNATSAKGKKGAAAKISVIRADLKASHSLKQQQVIANLHYLIDNGWVTEDAVQKTVVTKTGGHIPQTTPFYRITSKGVDRMEGGSQFEPKEKYAGININATGQNVITLGDGNVVHAQYKDLHSALGDLREAIAASSLTDHDKLNAVIDVESIRTALGRPDPDQGMIRQLWQKLGYVATVSGVATAYTQVAGLIGSLFGG